MYCPIRRLLQSISYVSAPSHSTAINGSRMNSDPLRNRAECCNISHFIYDVTSAYPRHPPTHSPYVHVQQVQQSSVTGQRCVFRTKDTSNDARSAASATLQLSPGTVTRDFPHYSVTPTTRALDHVTALPGS